MERISNIRIIAFRASKGDFLGKVAFRDPAAEKQTSNFGVLKPNIRVMFQYDDNSKVIKFDHSGFEEYLATHSLDDEFIRMVDDLIAEGNFRTV